MINIYDEFKNFAENFSFDEKNLNEKFDLIFGNNKTENYQEIEDLIKHLGPLFLYHDKVTSIEENILEKNLIFQDEKIKNVFQDLSRELNTIFENKRKNFVENPLDKLIGELNVHLYESNFDLQTSHSDFECENDDKLIYLDNASNYNIALLKKPLPINKKSIFGFKILESSDKIYLGVAYLNIAKKLNYYIKNYSIKQGMYMLRNDGHSLSHHEESMNDENNDFKFNENDSIFICFDYFKKKLTFRKKNEDGESNEIDTFCFDIKIKSNDILYPALMISSTSPKIEILSENQLREEKAYQLFHQNL